MNNGMLKRRSVLSFLSRTLFLGYILYTYVLNYALFYIPFFSFALLTGAVFFQLIQDNFRLRLDISMYILALFMIYVLVTGVLVARNFDQVTKSLVSLLEYVTVFYLVVRYIQTDGKPDFPMIAFIIQALVSVAFLIFRGSGFRRISIAETVNVNTIGVTLAFSIGFVLYLLIVRKPKGIKWVIDIGIIAMLMVGIMVTVSKKAILGAALLIGFWIVLCYHHTFARLKWIWKAIFFVGLIAVGVFVYSWYTSTYALQVEVFQRRMGEMYVGDSDQMRIALIKEGFSIFSSHPLFGVGFNNARYYTSMNAYTHCLYSESLACTGLFGTLIFAVVLIRPLTFISRKKRLYKRVDSIMNTQTKYMLAIYIVFFAMNLTQIAFYSQHLMYILAVVTGFTLISHDLEGNGDGAYCYKKSAHFGENRHEKGLL